MSHREQAKTIIDALPDYKMAAVVYFLKGMQYDDEIEDELFCRNMAEEYLMDESADKHDSISIEELASNLGVTL